MERIKPGYTKFKMLSGREAYVNMGTMKEVSASEAISGAVAESSRTEINESSNGDRLTSAFKELGLSGKEARLAAGSRKGNGAKSSKKEMREHFRTLGLSKAEAKLAEKRGRGGN